MNCSEKHLWQLLDVLDPGEPKGRWQEGGDAGKATPLVAKHLSPWTGVLGSC